MDTVILTAGTRGDVEPYVALGLGLAREGRRVRVVTHEPFRGFVESRGLGFAPLPGDPRELMADEAAQELFTTGRSLLRFSRRFISLLRPWWDELVEAATEAARGADLLVYSPLGFVAWHLGEAWRIPTVLAALQPHSRTTRFPPTPLGGRHLGPWGNLAAHLLGEQLAWQPLRRPVNQWRRTLGLPPLPLSGPFPLLRRRREPQLYGFSPRVVPPPPDWGPEVHVTGYWVLATGDDQLPAKVESFLAAGPPPVLVGLGSLAIAQAEEITRLAVSAVRRAGLRLLVQSGWAELGEGVSGDDLLVIGELPHRQLFPRVAAVVHHGGAGTTGTAFRAGAPQVVVPFYADQPFWGWRVAATGCGPPPLPFRRLTAEALAERIRLAAHPLVAAQARRMAAALQQEDGVGEAVQVLQRVVERGRSG